MPEKLTPYQVDLRLRIWKFSEIKVKQGQLGWAGAGPELGNKLGLSCAKLCSKASKPLASGKLPTN